MAHPNVDLMRRGYGAFADGDMDVVGSIFADNAVWHVGGDNDLSGDYEGKEAIFGFFGRLLQETEGSFKSDVHDLLANDEHAIALTNVSASRGGQDLNARLVEIYHVDGGKVTERWGFFDDQPVVDAFFS